MGKNFTCYMQKKTFTKIPDLYSDAQTNMSCLISNFFALIAFIYIYIYIGVTLIN